jgi:two-component system KDP operon response regulator KdpE
MSGTILIIDDDSRTRLRVRTALEQEGLRVVEQDPSGRPTAETLQPGYAVILLDIVMPEKDGFEYLRDIRRLWPAQRLIVYSHGLSDYTHYAVKLGANAGIDISGAANLRQLVETARRLASDADRPADNTPQGESGPSDGYTRPL